MGFNNFLEQKVLTVKLLKYLFIRLIEKLAQKFDDELVK